MVQRSRVFLILCVNPGSASYYETLQTLRYGEEVYGLVEGNTARGDSFAVGSSSPGFGSPVKDEDVADWRLLGGK